MGYENHTFQESSCWRFKWPKRWFSWNMNGHIMRYMWLTIWYGDVTWYTGTTPKNGHVHCENENQLINHQFCGHDIFTIFRQTQLEKPTLFVRRRPFPKCSIPMLVCWAVSSDGLPEGNRTQMPHGAARFTATFKSEQLGVGRHSSSMVRIWDGFETIDTSTKLEGP